MSYSFDFHDKSKGHDHKDLRSDCTHVWCNVNWPAIEIAITFLMIVVIYS